jgi:hypothetical protein
MTMTTEDLPCTQGEIITAVERILTKQLLCERMRSLPNELEREAYDQALDAFEDWAECYGLPLTPHVLAAYLIELHEVCGMDIDALKHVAGAYWYQYDRDVYVPIRAALNYCSR